MSSITRPEHVGAPHFRQKPRLTLMLRVFLSGFLGGYIVMMFFFVVGWLVFAREVFSNGDVLRTVVLGASIISLVVGIILGIKGVRDSDKSATVTSRR